MPRTRARESSQAMVAIPIFIRQRVVNERLPVTSYACGPCRGPREATVQGRYVYVTVNGMPTRVVEQSYAYQCASCGTVSRGPRPTQWPAIPWMRRSGHKVAAGVLGAVFLFAFGYGVIALAVLGPARARARQQAQREQSDQEAQWAAARAQRARGERQRDELAALLDASSTACERSAQALVGRAFPRGLPPSTVRRPVSPSKLRDATRITLLPSSGAPVNVTFDGPAFGSSCQSPLRHELDDAWPARPEADRATFAASVRASVDTIRDRSVVVVTTATCSRKPGASIQTIDLTASPDTGKLATSTVTVSVDTSRCAAAVGWVASPSGAVLAVASATSEAASHYRPNGVAFAAEVEKANRDALANATGEVRRAVEAIVDGWGG